MKTTLSSTLALLLASSSAGQQLAIGNNAPDPNCAPDEMEIRMDITFDNNPSDTQIGYNAYGLEGIDAPDVNLKKDGMDVAGKRAQYFACWPKNKVYRVFLTDDNRDGLAVPGEAEIRMNRLQVLKAPAENGNFYGNVLIAGDGDCVGSERRFGLEMVLDFYPLETTWEIKNTDSGDVIVSHEATMPSGPPGEFPGYPDAFASAHIFFDQCLPPGNYEFIIKDSGGDGIFNPGYYRLSMNRRVMKTGRRSFDAQENTPFQIEGPTPPPTPAPIPAPTMAPVPAPTMVTADEGPTSPPFDTIVIAPGSLCFSGDTLVNVKGSGRATKKMSELQVGDYVLAENNQYERVYSFGHRDVARKSEFLQLLPSKLELSKDHMLFVQGNDVAIPASMVKTGDILSDGVAVEAIRTVIRAGVYTPYTPSGKIVVNGVVASNYISLQNSDMLMVGSFKTPFSHHWLDHAFQTPHRIWCHYMGMRDSNLENGFSTWSEPPFRFCQWMLKQQSLVVMLALLIPFVTMLGFFCAVEAVLLYPFVSAVVVLSAMYLRRNNMSSMKQAV